VADLALLDTVITGDSALIQSPRLRGLRLGVPRGYFYENLDAELAPVIESGLRRLQDAGCVLVDADFPDIEKLSAISGRLSFYECMADLSSYLSSHGSTLTATEVVRQIASPDVREIYDTYVLGSKAPTLEWYQHAIAYDRPALQSAYRTYFHAVELRRYLRNNSRGLINYGLAWRNGRRISTAPAESGMGHLVKERMGRGKPIRWSANGANLLLQVRCAVLDDRLDKLFREWYPRFQRTPWTVGIRGRGRVPLGAYETFQRAPSCGLAPPGV
jgi:hypothetical protein